MLLAKIKTQRVAAFKNKDTNKEDKEKYLSLTLVMGELARLDSKEPSDSEVAKVLSKMIKSATETNSLKPSDELVSEIALLKSFLPTELSEIELSKVIDQLFSETPTLPAVMKALKERYTGQYNGKLASELINKKL